MLSFSSSKGSAAGATGHGDLDRAMSQNLYYQALRASVHQTAPGAANVHHHQHFHQYPAAGLIPAAPVEMPVHVPVSTQTPYFAQIAVPPPPPPIPQPDHRHRLHSVPPTGWYQDYGNNTTMNMLQTPTFHRNNLHKESGWYQDYGNNATMNMLQTPSFHSNNHDKESGKMAPRAPPRVHRRTVAEIDREYDELSSALSKDPRDQLPSGAGQIATRLRSHSSQTDNAGDHVDSDVAMDENNQINAAAHNTKGPAKGGRKVTIHDQLHKRRAKGRHIDIKFPKEFAKVCGEHASLFKSEISVLVRTIPLQVKKWKNMDEFHPGTTTSIWKKLKEKFPELSEEDKDCSMRQVESQYNNRRYRLLQAYRNKKPRPQHVSPEGWQWLIRNLWTDDDFQKRSNQNSINRGKQEMGSKVGNRSIAQIAYELRNPETGEWPTAMQVWRATYQMVDGTWSIPTGEEIMTKLDEAAGIHQEKISSAPVPIVEHFALVLGRKPNHSRGVGIRAVNKVAEERMRLQAQVEASEQREAAARARADAAEQRVEAAEQRAQALEGQVSTVVETNAQMQEEQQSQRDALSSLRQAQSEEVARLVKEQLDEQMAELVLRIHSSASQPPAS